MGEVLKRERSIRVYVKSFGCPTNISDGEAISGCLSTAGYDVVENPEDADVLIYNTCAVKSPTENRMFHLLREAPKDKRLVVAGCLPLISFERLKTEARFDALLGPAPAPRVAETIHRISQGETLVHLENDSKPELGLPRIRVHQVVGIIPINYGCLGNCSYCCVLFARGRLRSYEASEIVERVKLDLTLGAREIWLTSQDTAAYGRDIETDLSELLRQICKVEGEFRVRVGMMTPNLALERLDALIQAYKNGKIFKFLHLPVQSGDDKVLTLMNRFYSIEDFRRIVQRFRKEIPEITIATDVICGFPGERQEAFRQTMRLIEEVAPDVVNISRFFPRPGTPAQEMKQLAFAEIKTRSKMMAELSKRISLARNKTWREWEGPVLIDEKGKGTSWIGRNFAYKPMVVKSGKSLLGKFVTVRVTRVFPTYLMAEMT